MASGIFGATTIVTAMLDRLLYHATTINMRGESDRLRERRKAGLLAPVQPNGHAARTGR